MSVQVRLKSTGREVIEVPADGSVSASPTLPDGTATARVFINPVDGGTGAQIISLRYDPDAGDPDATDGIIITDAGGYIELPSGSDVRNLRMVSLNATRYLVFVVYHGAQ